MAPGWRCRSWPTIWPVGPRASGWASGQRSPPKHSDSASSPWRDGSPAKHAASPCISPKDGLGKTSSAAPPPDCGHYPYPPDVGVAVWPVPKASQPPQGPMQAEPRVTPAANWPPTSPPLALQAVRNPLPPIATPSNRPHLPASSPGISFPPLSTFAVTLAVASLRWIRAKGETSLPHGLRAGRLS